MAKQHKGPSVEPLHGDLRADPGSRDWALGVRASLWGKERDLGSGVGDVALRLERLLVTDGWKHLFRADGTPFETFEEYLTYRTPYGMGVPLEMMRHYLGLTHEGRTLRQRLAVKGNPTRRVALADLRTDGGTQVREAMKDATVEEYAAALADGAAFPPVVVFFDGKDHWLADGFHRVAAHEAAGIVDVLAEVREGTREDALWFALSANKRHGLPMSNADKQRAVKLALASRPHKSDREIAATVGVHHNTVTKARADMGVPTGELRQLAPSKTEGADGKSRPSPGAAANKVRDFLADPANTGMSNKAVAEALDVARDTVARVRNQMAAAATPAASDEKKAPTPAPPARHPVLAEIEQAADLAALDRAFNKVAGAGQGKLFGGPSLMDCAPASVDDPWLEGRAKKVRRYGAPEIIAAVGSGVLNLRTAAQLVTLPVDQQAALVARGADACRAEVKAMASQRKHKTACMSAQLPLGHTAEVEHLRAENERLRAELEQARGSSRRPPLRLIQGSRP